MKTKLFCAVALIAMACGHSFAADMPIVKAPANPFAYPAGNGFYFGVGSVGGGGPANVSVVGLNSNSLVTNQIAVGGLVGYAWNVPNSAMFAAVEGWFGYTNFNGTAQGLSFSGPAMLKQRFLFGAPVDQIAAFFPTWGLAPPTFPVLPPGQAVKSTKAYVGATIDENDISLNFGNTSNKVWEITPGVTVGVLAQLTSGSVLDVFSQIKFHTQGHCVGNTAGLGCGTIGNEYLAGVALKW